MKCVCELSVYSGDFEAITLAFLLGNIRVKSLSVVIHMLIHSTNIC